MTHANSNLNSLLQFFIYLQRIKSKKNIAKHMHYYYCGTHALCLASAGIFDKRSVYIVHQVSVLDPNNGNPLFRLTVANYRSSLGYRRRVRSQFLSKFVVKPAFSISAEDFLRIQKILGNF